MNQQTITGYLNEVMQAIDKLLDAAPRDIQGAINWADLRCIETMKSINQDGESRFIAIVAEAAPTNEALKIYLERRLMEQGHDFEVRTEW